MATKTIAILNISSFEIENIANLSSRDNEPGNGIIDSSIR